MRTQRTFIPIRKRTRARGFSLLELLVVVIILILIAGFVTPYMLDTLDTAKINKILATHARVSKAVSEFRTDITVGNPGMRQDDPEQLPIETPPNRHDLFYSTGLKGWDGPYLTHPLGDSDNPFGGDIRLANTLAQDWNITGTWKIQGEGGPELGGTGSYLQFTLIPIEMAMKIDDILDRDIVGSNGQKGSAGSEWGTVGRCLWVANDSGRLEVLSLFILDANGKAD